MVTAYRRVQSALDTITRIRACQPPPAEVLVHVDGGEEQTANAIARTFPDISVIVSPSSIGPGGGRNLMASAARHEIIASFDDDSYPIDRDYFARLARLFEDFPAAAVVDAHVFHLNQDVAPDTEHSEWVADFSGGGCAYRRAGFLETGGYVPLPTAYGMEEVDFALRLHARGGRVLRSRRLRVFHNTDLERHAAASVTAASIANIALLAYLRYPRGLWGIGAAQCVRRIVWLLGHRRWRGIIAGLTAIPGAIGGHRQARNPVPGRALRSYLSLRRRPVPVSDVSGRPRA